MIDSGLIPANCTHFELILDAKDAIRAKCTFSVSEEQMQQIATALKQNPDEAKEIIRTAIVSTDYRLGQQDFEKIPELVF